MNDRELENIGRDPKFAPSHYKASKTKRSVKDLFDGIAPEQTFKDKRGRPWLKNPRAYVKNKLSRGTQSDESISESEESSIDDKSDSSSLTGESEADAFESVADLQGADWYELTKDSAIAENATRRLALLHFDWDHAKPETIYMVLESFLPARGHIERVTIYPSKFGIEKMNEEALHGPVDLHRAQSDLEDNEQSETITSTTIDEKAGWRSASQNVRRRIRDYQLARLKYFYAIIEFDSVETAKAVYGACDGVEYESSGSRFDLRFVDDDEQFEVDPKYSHLVTQCREVNKGKYEPLRFETSALHSTRIGVTWEKTPLERTKWFQKQFREDFDPEHISLTNNDELGTYLALSSSGASTAASSDVDAPPPAPTVPRIPKHRPKKLPPGDVRIALLGCVDSVDPSDLTISDTHQMIQDCDTSETEQVYDIQNDQSDDEDYDLGPVEKVLPKQRAAKSMRGSVSRYSALELHESPQDSSEQDSAEEGDVDRAHKLVKSSKRSKRLKQKAKMLAKKQKLQSRIEKQSQLWQIKNMDGSVSHVDDDRFDEFFLNPAFGVSQTHADYKEAKEFLQFMQSRKLRNQST